LWYFKNAPKKYHIHELNKLQQRAALWITRAFKTSPTEGIEGIAGLIPIHFHLCKLAGRSQLRFSKIPPNHAISSLLKHSHSQPLSSHTLALSNLTPKQKTKTKSPLLDIDQWLTQTHPAFVTYNKHILTPGNRIVDTFPSKFSFHFPSSSDSENKNHHINSLKNAFSLSQSSLSNICIVADEGVKREAATAIAHIWHSNSIIDKKKLYATDVLPIEAKIMSMCLGLDLALERNNIDHITLITGSIQGAKAFFDT